MEGSVCILAGSKWTILQPHLPNAEITGMFDYVLLRRFLIQRCKHIYFLFVCDSYIENYYNFSWEKEISSIKYHSCNYMSKVDENDKRNSDSLPDWVLTSIAKYNDWNMVVLFSRTISSNFFWTPIILKETKGKNTNIPKRRQHWRKGNLWSSIWKD